MLHIYIDHRSLCPIRILDAIYHELTAAHACILIRYLFLLNSTAYKKVLGDSDCLDHIAQSDLDTSGSHITSLPQTPFLN